MKVDIVAHDAFQKIEAIHVAVRKTRDIMHLKWAISSCTGISVHRLVVGELWKGKKCHFFDNYTFLENIRSNDDIWAWELPEMDEEFDRNSQYDFAVLMPITSGGRGNVLGVATESLGIPLPLLVSNKRKMPGKLLRKNIESTMTPWVIADSDGSIPYVMSVLDRGDWTIKREIPNDDTLIDVERVWFGANFKENINVYRKERLPVGK
eukprot:TRINITY_DN1714_c0_g2_i1.p1 TRINITY_DN1714_c0_g2~~TRINITY_DN1714_c0_g2_i1.p1  ORF type:complete len:208 (+),score=40.36 TRINITY_DN1714_c0_g2_i1:472-1095(+)